MPDDITIHQVESQEDIEAVRDLMREYITWAFTLDAESGSAPTFEGIEQELAGLPGIYVPPSGRLLLAKHKGRAAGCVCLKPIEEATSEVKRLYVRPEARGLNVGNLLVARLVEEARQIGYRRIVLDSHISMTRAHAIYETAGFKRVPTPDDFPAHLKPIAIFMECSLV
jgi:putative acetyltransferase